MSGRERKHHGREPSVPSWSVFLFAMCFSSPVTTFFLAPSIVPRGPLHVETRGFVPPLHLRHALIRSGSAAGSHCHGCRFPLKMHAESTQGLGESEEDDVAAAVQRVLYETDGSELLSLEDAEQVRLAMEEHHTKHGEEASRKLYEEWMFRSEEEIKAAEKEGWRLESIQREFGDVWERRDEEGLGVGDQGMPGTENLEDVKAERGKDDIFMASSETTRASDGAERKEGKRSKVEHSDGLKESKSEETATEAAEWEEILQVMQEMKELEERNRHFPTAESIKAGVSPPEWFEGPRLLTPTEAMRIAAGPDWVPKKEREAAQRQAQGDDIEVDAMAIEEAVEGFEYGIDDEDSDELDVQRGR